METSNERASRHCGAFSFAFVPPLWYSCQYAKRTTDLAGQDGGHKTPRDAEGKANYHEGREGREDRVVAVGARCANGCGGERNVTKWLILLCATLVIEFATIAIQNHTIVVQRETINLLVSALHRSPS